MKPFFISRAEVVETLAAAFVWAVFLWALLPECDGRLACGHRATHEQSPSVSALRVGVDYRGEGG